MNLLYIAGDQCGTDARLAQRALSRLSQGVSKDHLQLCFLDKGEVQHSICFKDQQGLFYRPGITLWQTGSGGLWGILHAQQ